MLNRHKALAIAATVAITVSAAGVATAVNVGLLSSAASEPVGQLDAKNVASLTDTVPSPTVASTTTTTAAPVDPEIVYQDEYVTAPPVPGVTPAPAPSHEQGAPEANESHPAPTPDGPTPAPVRRDDDSRASAPGATPSEHVTTTVAPTATTTEPTTSTTSTTRPSHTEDPRDDHAPEVELDD